MLGSFQDAEDALQDSFLAAGRASAGTRVAHRSALALPDCHEPVPQHTSLSQKTAGQGVGNVRDRTSRADAAWRNRWLEPYPDALLEGAFNAPLGPEARYEQTEAISLTFVTALQVLPARQRAVLILREVLGYHADEVADMLDSTVDSVNSALKRARTRPAAPPVADRRVQPPLARLGGRTAAGGKVRPRLRVRRCRRAGRLLTADVVVSMPPIPLEYQGRDVVTRFYASIFAEGRAYDLVPRGQTVSWHSALYLRTPAGRYPPRGRPHRAHPCRRPDLRDDSLRQSVLPWFGLPRSLPG